MPQKAPIKFFSTVGRYDKLRVHYIEIPETVMKKLEPKARLLCSVNSQEAFQCGIMPLADGKGYITLSGKRMKIFGVIYGDRIHVALSYDKSELGMPMPEELAVLLEQDTEGRERFEQLSAAKKRYIVYYVNQVKNPQLRIDRSLKTIGNLKKTIPGKEDFRIVFGYPPRE